MKYVSLALMLLLLVGCSGHQPSADDPTTGKVHLSLRANPHQGFAPLHISFHVNLEGVADNDESLYCLREEWDFGDGAVSSEKPNCEPFGPDTKITSEFFADHQYQNTGTYSVRFILGDYFKSQIVSIIVMENRTGANSGQ